MRPVVPWGSWMAVPLLLMALTAWAGGSPAQQQPQELLTTCGSRC